MLIRGIYLEQDIVLEHDLINGLAGAFREFMDFHQAEDLVFERKEDAQIGAQIASFL
jgi:hypothetical protein